jgi:Prp8 binding protein
MMPAVKRQASESFSSSSQLVVKRQKSNADLRDGSALTVVGGQNGALVQSVCLPLIPCFYSTQS